MMRGLVSVTRSRGERRPAERRHRRDGETAVRRACGAEWNTSTTSAAHTSEPTSRCSALSDGGSRFEHHRRSHDDLHHRDAEHEHAPTAARLAPPSTRRLRTRDTTTIARPRKANASTRWVQCNAASGVAGGSRLPSQSGRPRHSRPAWKFATWAPKRITMKPSAASASDDHARVAPRSASAARLRRLRRPERHHQQRGQQNHRVGEVGDDDPGGQSELDGDGTREAPAPRAERRRAWRGRGAPGSLPVADPRDHGQSQHDHAHQCCRPPVPDLDHRREIERREPLPVASGPVVAASQPGAGNADHAAKHDQA